MTDRARQLLLWHIAELDALLKRMGPDHLAYERTKERLEECKNHLL